MQQVASGSQSNGCVAQTVEQSPHKTEVVGSNPTTATKIAGYGSGLSAESHKLGIVGSNPTPAPNLHKAWGDYWWQPIIIHFKVPVATGKQSVKLGRTF